MRLSLKKAAFFRSCFFIATWFEMIILNCVVIKNYFIHITIKYVLLYLGSVHIKASQK